LTVAVPLTVALIARHVHMGAPETETIPVPDPLDGVGAVPSASLAQYELPMPGVEGLYQPEEPREAEPVYVIVPSVFKRMEAEAVVGAVLVSIRLAVPP
jgi:hypothetical protein